MLLDNNTEKVIDLLNIYDDLNDVDKVRLSIHLLEDLGFTPTYDINNFIKLLKNVLLILDPESKNVITNENSLTNLNSSEIYEKYITNCNFKSDLIIT